ncbi:FecCD family ABC transporter permease [Kallotenue papyrolyticum]|uniref:FecCD family ABC transporter permease n=1 Tax=Kallotenue papyrolyticum TaxID=1325125 RepID=UPI0004BA34D3|nr:iron chelate uptake ABC transporter family permease subunit [Kallotenue papyrolyticum]
MSQALLSRAMVASRPPAASRLGFGALLSGLGLALLATVTLAVMIGPVPLAPTLVWRVALHQLLPGLVTPNWETYQFTIIWEIRFPRVLLGGLVGAGLALIGTTMQALVRNPLADPYLLGVSSGASLGAVTVMLLGVRWFGSLSLSISAFLGALLAFSVVYVLAQQGGRLTTGRLILAGVAVSYIFSAMTNVLIFNADNGEAVKSAIFWMLGGLGGARWDYLGLPALVLLLGSAYLVLQARALNILSIGEETAATLGVDAGRFRRQVLTLTSLMTGTLVAVSGGIGFVGLMLPHILRLLVGAEHHRLLPVAALAGAIFLIWVDVLARVVVAPQELPIGIITALLGAPFCIWLMRRGNALAGGYA